MAEYIRSSITSARFFLLLLVLVPAAAAAQTPTGTIGGRVTDSQGRSVGAATVAVQSPALQGIQTATTTVNGDYILRGLPPGRYTLSIDARGFSTITRFVDLAPTQVVTVSVELNPASVRESVTVAAVHDAFVDTVQVARNIPADEVRSLPADRTLLSYVDLAPGVHATGPEGARTINGAMSFENAFLLNGMQMQDNLRRTPLALYIEDAIQETTVATSGISAEYGRFMGGVVNAVTKSGGNIFSGSMRVGFTNDSWRTVTPENEPRVDVTVPTYEFTFGGPIVRDRTWFFGAGRFFDQTVARETGITRVPYDLKSNERRYEGKLTQALATAHRLQLSYTGLDRRDANTAWPSPGEVLDLTSLTTRQLPQRMFSASYMGSVTTNFFLEAQYSTRTLSFVGDGGKFADRVQGTPLCSPSFDCFSGGGFWYWTPAFCGICQDEQRDNDQFVVKGSYFISTAAGAHNLVVGYDGFTDKMTLDNHMSSSNFQIWPTDFITDNGNVYPVIGGDGSTVIVSGAIPETSQGTRFRSHGLFVNDSWMVNRRLSLQLGLRYDRNSGKDASRNTVATDGAFSPRLGATYTPNDGQTTVSTSYSRYVTSLANNIANAASPAGQPAILAYAYLGDSINEDGGPLVPADVAIQRVFDWFDASGGATLFFADIPGLATRFPRSLRSPYTDEFAVGLGQRVGQRAAVRLDFINRSSGNFYADQIDMTTGQVTDEFGQMFDLRHIVNSNDFTRRYRALNAQTSYRAGTQLVFGASYTLSRLWGNINGENARSGPVTSSSLTYPEYSDPAWRNPEGDLAADQRHRARIWSTIGLPFFGPANNLSVGIVQLAESGSPYGASGVIDTTPYVDDPGYAPPLAVAFTGVPYFFTSRDAFRTESMFRTDLAINYGRRIGAGRQTEIFTQFQVFNVFNQFQLFNISGNAINTTVLTAINDPSLEPFNPFTDTPVEGVHWAKGARFGQPINASAYTAPRLFRFSVGLRF